MPVVAGRWTVRHSLGRTFSCRVADRATSNKGIAASNKGIASSSFMLLVMPLLLVALHLFILARSWPSSVAQVPWPFTVLLQDVGWI